MFTTLDLPQIVIVPHLIIRSYYYVNQVKFILLKMSLHVHAPEMFKIDLVAKKFGRSSQCSFSKVSILSISMILWSFLWLCPFCQSILQIMIPFNFFLQLFFFFSSNFYCSLEEREKFRNIIRIFKIQIKTLQYNDLFLLT